MNTHAHGVLMKDPETRKVLRSFGGYDDQLAKRDGQWLFTRREYCIVYVCDN